MADEPKLSLRDFQTRLAERLRNAAQTPGTASKLGFLAGDRHWLTDLEQINEVVTVPSVTPVPWAKPWFTGAASVRGAIYGCMDLAAFLAVAKPLEDEECRLLLLHPRYGVNAALRIQQPLGLRSLTGMKRLPLAAADNADTLQAKWLDPEGISWLELDVEQLIAKPDFFQAGI